MAEFINIYVGGFNEATRVLARQLTASLPGSTFVYGNSYDLVAGTIANPAKYGKKNKVKKEKEKEFYCSSLELGLSG